MISTKLPPQSPLLGVMTKSVVKASKLLLRDFGELENLQVSVKSNKAFVTSADLKADAVLKDEMLRARPTYSLLSEESAEIVGEEPSLRWIIDPLDGTLNYMHGFPHWAISVACEKNGEIVAAVTYDPVKNEMFLAEKGCGAYVNDKKIRVSGKRARSDLLIGVSSFSKIDHLVKNIPSATCSIRKSGSITLDMAYLAAGRIDILFAPENLNEWDVAAGMLLIREAGGFLASPDGKSVSDYKDIAMMSNIDLLPIATKMF